MALPARMKRRAFTALAAAKTTPPSIRHFRHVTND